MADRTALLTALSPNRLVGANLATGTWIRTALPFLVLAAWPFGLLVLDGDWIFTPLGTIDPWVYLGYIFDLPGHLHAFSGLYYGTRLSYLLPASVLFQLLPPVVADYALHLITYYIVVFAMYFTLRHVFGPNTGLVTAVLLSSSYCLLVSVGWDYVNGAGIAYESLALLCLIRAVRSSFPGIWIWLAGFFLAAMITTYTFLITVTPCFALVFIWLNWRGKPVDLVRRIVMLVSGGLSLAALLGAYNLSVGGDFVYFLPALNFAAGWLAGSVTFGRLVDYLPRANWLVAPSLAAVSSIAVLLTWAIRRTGGSKYTALFYTSFLVALAIWSGWEFSGKYPVLLIDYYANYLIPWTFLVIGAVLSPAANALTRRQLQLLVAGAVLGLVLVGNAGTEFVLGSVPFLVLLASAAGLVAIAVLASLGRLDTRHWPSVAVCIVFAFGFTLWNGKMLLASPASVRHDGSNAFAMVADGYRVLAVADPEMKLLFWYSAEEADGEVFEALASTYLWAYRLIGIHFPVLGGDLSDGVVKASLRPGARVAILSNDGDAVAKARQSLAERSITFDVESATPVEHRGTHNMTITVIKISQMRPPA